MALFVQLDTNWPDHGKVARVGLDGAGLHAIAMCVAKRTETDGWIDRFVLSRYGPQEVIDRLLEVGLLEAEGEVVRPSGWLDTNPSQGAIDASRASKREAGKAGNHRRYNHPGPLAECRKCNPNPQVVAGCESERSQSLAGDLRVRSPESYTESESETYPESPPDSQSDPPPGAGPPSPVVVDEQMIRRTAALVGKALAVGADNPGAYAAAATKRILTGDDPTDRDEIYHALTEGLTPEAIAEGWDPGPPDPLGAIVGPRAHRQTTEAEQAQIRARAAEHIAEDQARRDEALSGERAPIESVKAIAAEIRTKRRGGAA